MTDVALNVAGLMLFGFCSYKTLFNSEQASSVHSMFASRQYICIILSFGFLIYEVLFYVMTSSNIYRMVLTIVAAVMLAVLPGRIIRRGVVAMEETILIEKQMNYKNTFVRYVSHEVR